MKKTIIAGSISNSPSHLLAGHHVSLKCFWKQNIFIMLKVMCNFSKLYSTYLYVSKILVHYCSLSLWSYLLFHATVILSFSITTFFCIPYLMNEEKKHTLALIPAENNQTNKQARTNTQKNHLASGFEISFLQYN